MTRGCCCRMCWTSWRGTGHDVAGARLLRSQPRETLQLHRTLADAGVTNMETLVVEAGSG